MFASFFRIEHFKGASISDAEEQSVLTNPCVDWSIDTGHTVSNGELMAASMIEQVYGTALIRKCQVEPVAPIECSRWLRRCSSSEPHRSAKYVIPLFIKQVD